MTRPAPNTARGFQRKRGLRAIAADQFSHAGCWRVGAEHIEAAELFSVIERNGYTMIVLWIRAMSPIWLKRASRPRSCSRQ